MKNLCFSNQSLKINDKINSIRRAYSFEDIFFFPRNTLKKLSNYIISFNDYNFDMFSLKKDNNEMNIISNIHIKKDTFISEIIGLYCYRKTINYKDENKIGFKDIFIFKCHDNSYDRFLKSLLFDNIDSIIAANKTKKKVIVKL